jgi:hypothetical protein
MFSFKEEKTSKMFLLDGRKDQDAINMGHIEPLNTRDQTKSNHYPEKCLLATPVDVTICKVREI